MPAAVVTPTYNERENLLTFLERVRQALPDASVLIVDDASPDGTGELAEELGRTHGRVEVLHRPGKLGLGSAYREGFARALTEGFDPIFQMDADLSHDPSDLPRLAAAGADLAIGSRYVEGGGTKGWPVSRKLISRGSSLGAHILLGLPFRDITGGFKCWRASCLQGISFEDVRSDGFFFQVETTWRAYQGGFRVVEVPIVFTERATGASKMNTDIAREALRRALALRLGR